MIRLLNKSLGLIPRSVGIWIVKLSSFSMVTILLWPLSPWSTSDRTTHVLFIVIRRLLSLLTIFVHLINCAILPLILMTSSTLCSSFRYCSIKLYIMFDIFCWLIYLLTSITILSVNKNKSSLQMLTSMTICPTTISYDIKAKHGLERGKISIMINDINDPTTTFATRLLGCKLIHKYWKEEVLARVVEATA